jgi:hypothetical protein
MDFLKDITKISEGLNSLGQTMETIKTGLPKEMQDKLSEELASQKIDMSEVEGNLKKANEAISKLFTEIAEIK